MIFFLGCINKLSIFNFLTTVMIIKFINNILFKYIVQHIANKHKHI